MYGYRQLPRMPSRAGFYFYIRSVHHTTARNASSALELAATFWRAAERPPAPLFLQQQCALLQHRRRLHCAILWTATQRHVLPSASASPAWHALFPQAGLSSTGSSSRLHMLAQSAPWQPLRAHHQGGRHRSRLGTPTSVQPAACGQCQVHLCQTHDQLLHLRRARQRQQEAAECGVVAHPSNLLLVGLFKVLNRHAAERCCIN